MNNRIRLLLLYGACLLSAGGANAQEDDDRSDGLLMEEIIVTGVGGGNPLSKLDSSVAITTKGELQISQRAPLNIVDMIATVPGFWAESSGGESGAGNVFIRGLPQDGGFIFMQQLEDGLPVLLEPSVNFLPVDAFAKIDETVARFEAVRGGSAAVFATGAPGGMVNLVTKNPTDVPEGRIKVQIGDYNHVRTDFVHSGPLSDDWNYLIGGFYRQDDGIRDPGFTANKGYQFRARLARDFDRGSLWVDYKNLDDSGIFYLPIGLDNPNPTGGAFDEARSIPGTDATTFTATSADHRRILLRHPNGVNDRSPDMADGIGADSDQFTLALEYDLGGGWLLDARTRLTQADVSFISGISIGQPTPAESVVSDLVAEAQALGASGDPRYNGTGPSGIVLSQVAGAAIDYTNSGSVFDIANQNGNGLVYETGWWDVRWKVDNFVADWKISKAWGDHDLTIGLYFGRMETNVLKDWANILHDFKQSTELVDITFTDVNGDPILDAAGNPVQRTENGVWRYGFNYEQRTDEMTTVALYLYDEWQVNDDLRVDFGLRYDNNHYNGTFGISPGMQDFDGNAVDSLFLAGDGVSVGIPDRFDDYDRSLNELSFSLGGNYAFTDQQAVFARYSVGYDFPKGLGGDTLFVTRPSGEFIEAGQVTQIEVGYKLSSPNWSVFASVFSSEVEDQVFNDNIILPDGSQTQLNLLFGSETTGLEAEVIWYPTDNVEIAATATFQSPEYSDLGIASGNQVRRIPEEIFMLTPTYRFSNGSYIYLTWFRGGERFADFSNLLLLPEYDQIDAGASWYVTDRLNVRLQGFNLTDEIGLTEGNPRGNPTEFGDLFTGRPILGRHFRANLTWDF